MSDERIDYLLRLTEDQLRNVVLIPLLTQIGFQDVIEYHGTVEKGKDIICRYNDILGVTKYIGVVVKRVDIHGAISKSGNAGEILLQIQQTFDESYTDIFNLKEVVIDECWVVTSGIVKPTAIESIQGILKKSNLNKLVRFIDQRKLCSLIDRHLPGFWHSDRYLMLLLHDLRTPIVSVRSAAHYLEMISNHENRFDRNRVLKTAKNIEFEMDLVYRMLESYYLFTVSKLRVNLKMDDLNEVVARVVKSIYPLAQRMDNKPISIEFQKAPGNVTCEIDNHMVSQAIWNLIANGLRYADPRQPVMVTVEDNDCSADVVVTDFGIGIPPDASSKVLEPHFRADNAIQLSPAGVGLGLTVAERVARAHDGAILIRNCANPTIVVLTLPKRSQQ